jgi:phosphate transport system substrate-binding protein
MSLSSRMVSQILSMKKFAAVIPAGLVVALAACSPQTPTAAPGSSMAPAASAKPASGGATVSISGAGATAPNPLYQKWFAEFNKKNPNIQISYQSVGSGAGIKQYLAKTVDFGATDSALKKDEKEQFPADRGTAIQVPSTGLFVVFAYNLDGVKGLKLSRETFCGIADGSIKKWNDEKLKKDNAGATLPDSDITFVYRSDGSGTTSIFTKHIEKACPNWKAGSGKSVEWPTGTGAKGNEGVTAQLKQTKGSIGYTEYSFAKENGLEMATIQNKAGEFVAPTPDAAAKALSGVKIPEDFAVSVPDPEAKDAYPIVSLTWLLFYSKYEDAAKADALKSFTKWALTDGKTFATDLGYIPLPEDVATKASAAVDAIGK